MPKESLTEQYAKKAKFKTPSGAGKTRDRKLAESEKKAVGKTAAKRMKK